MDVLLGVQLDLRMVEQRACDRAASLADRMVKVAVAEKDNSWVERMVGKLVCSRVAM